MMSGKFKKFILPLFIVAIGMAILLLLVFAKTKPQVKTVEKRRWLVGALQVYPETYAPNVVLYGRVESPNTADLESTVTANVESTPALEGAFVKKGQLLIQLEEQEVKFIYEQRKANVDQLEAEIKAEQLKYQADLVALEHEEGLIELAKKNLSRREHLVKTQAGSEAQLDTARDAVRRAQLAHTVRKLSVEQHESRLKALEARLAQAKAIYKQAALDLKRTRIVAPFDGRVAKLLVAEGERVQPGQELIKLFDMSRLEVRAQIPIQYMERLHEVIKEQNKLVGKGDIDGRDFTLELDRLSGEVTVGRAGVDGLFRVKSGEQFMALGRTVDFSLDLPEVNNVYAIPLRSLYEGEVVYKIVNDQLDAVKVTRIGTHGLPDQTKVLLVRSAELQPGDWILTTNIPNAVSGLAVKVQAENYDVDKVTLPSGEN